MPRLVNVIVHFLQNNMGTLATVSDTVKAISHFQDQDHRYHERKFDFKLGVGDKKQNVTVRNRMRA